jgi:hypothetical protein
MRYLLILVVALALTIAWQTSVVADIPTEFALRCNDTTPHDEQRAEPGTAEPDCE